MRKVPQVTALFWIVKILTTALGESTSDFLVRVIDPVVAVGIGGAALCLALVMQFWARSYTPSIYWFAVAMVAVSGTMAADVLHIGLGVPYLYSSTFFAVALVVIFILWYATEKTLSIHSITNWRRELFYWATVITTFALGTAAGDMTASTLGLGYLVSGILFGALIVVVAFAHRYEPRNAVVMFWLAYILTRPLGASFADWMGKARSIGGLGWGDGTVSIGLGVLIVCLVAYLSVSRADTERA